VSVPAPDPIRSAPRLDRVEGHQIELADEPRRVEVVIDGIVVASSTRTLTLAETGLPLRHYFPRDDVAWEHLHTTTTETVCPFKGQASYWTVRVGDTEHNDVAWAYETPIDGVDRIAGHVCFYVERADHVIDGEVVERPLSPWSQPAG
jgi:uncharacterized protein (DUF427 family)